MLALAVQFFRYPPRAMPSEANAVLSRADGRIAKVGYFRGCSSMPISTRPRPHNERNALVIDAEGGRTVTLVQVAGLIARRILCYVKAGDRLERGQRYGFIRFGSRVDVYLPLEATPKVAPGDSVYATSTVLATFAR